MKTTVLAVAVLTAASFAFAAPAQPGTPASHAHEAAAPQLDNGSKWQTDATLRRGMGEIRRALAARLDALREEKLDAAEYRRLGVAIEAQVADIVANCKLPPAADANLHPIIAQLVAATDALQGKSGAPDTPEVGARRALFALHQYGAYFADPDWKPLT
jgi:hypothetical protein